MHFCSSRAKIPCIPRQLKPIYLQGAKFSLLFFPAPLTPLYMCLSLSPLFSFYCLLFPLSSSPTSYFSPISSSASRFQKISRSDSNGTLHDRYSYCKGKVRHIPSMNDTAIRTVKVKYAIFTGEKLCDLEALLPTHTPFWYSLAYVM